MGHPLCGLGAIKDREILGRLAQMRRHLERAIGDIGQRIPSHGLLASHIAPELFRWIRVMHCMDGARRGSFPAHFV